MAAVWLMVRIAERRDIGVLIEVCCSVPDLIPTHIRRQTLDFGPIHFQDVPMKHHGPAEHGAVPFVTIAEALLLCFPVGSSLAQGAETT